MKETSRRGFIGTAAMAAGGMMAGCGTAAAARKDDGFIWAALLHMGTNMWCDQMPEEHSIYKGENLSLICKADHVRFDEKVWRSLTAHMVEVGMNMVVIDLGEAIKYPSHPELWVEGSWEIERFRKELARLRAMGLEPIPKLNFSAAHDIWLKDYERMLSTPEYYKVCSDVIRDVSDIFDRPRFMHIGYDEEIAHHQRRYLYCAVRQGDLWWHDFNWFVDTVEKAGMRPWIWSDYAWHHPDLFYKRMSKSVLQSNWYYGLEFDIEKMKKNNWRPERVQTYIDLDKAGFDQIPTGSNWSCDGNFAATVDFCRRNCTSGSVKGFMTAPWFFTLPGWERKCLDAIDQVGAVIRAGA